MRSSRKIAAALLALLMLAACAACAEKQQEPEEEQQIAGADWRTWGWVNDAESITQGGKTTDVLVCVFTDEIDLYLDDETQTLYAAVSYCVSPLPHPDCPRCGSFHLTKISISGILPRWQSPRGAGG